MEMYHSLSGYMSWLLLTVCSTIISVILNLLGHIYVIC